MLASIWQSNVPPGSDDISGTESSSSSTDAMKQLQNRARRTEKARLTKLLNRATGSTARSTPELESKGDPDPAAKHLQSVFFMPGPLSKAAYKHNVTGKVDYKTWAKDRARALWSYLDAMKNSLLSFFSGISG